MDGVAGQVVLDRAPGLPAVGALAQQHLGITGRGGAGDVDDVVAPPEGCDGHGADLGVSDLGPALPVVVRSKEAVSCPSESNGLSRRGADFGLGLPADDLDRSGFEPILATNSGPVA